MVPPSAHGVGRRKSFVPNLASDPRPAETCEQRRAREYGIDNDPRPHARDYSDPIMFAIDLNEWVRRDPDNRKLVR